MKGAQIHRFGDRVAVSMPGKGQTVYLSAAEANKLAKALNGCAKSVKTEPKFSESTFATVAFDIADPFRE